MRKFKRQRIVIKTFKLPRIEGPVKQAIPFLAFALSLSLICAAGAVNALESFGKRAGGSSRVVSSALFLELGIKSGKDPMQSLLSVAFPAFGEKQASTNAALTPQTSAVPLTPPPSASPSPSATPRATPAAKTPTPSTAPPAAKPSDKLSAEGIELKGEKDGIDVAALLNEPLGLIFDGSPQILIIHTHSTESYVCDGSYNEVGNSRTLDSNHSVIKVGDELASALKNKGYTVIHDRGVYDYPSYTGSYDRSMAAVSAYLKKYPSIKIVFDIHRDAATDSNGNALRTVANLNGKDVSQVMMVVGMGSPGLENPHWKENLKLALRLQASMNSKYPDLARPIEVSSERYNQQAAPGSLLVEFGYNGNTLDESISSVRLFAEAFSAVLNN